VTWLFPPPPGTEKLAALASEALGQGGEQIVEKVAGKGVM